MRKKSRYKPRPIVNPLTYVLEGFRPVRSHESYMVMLTRTHEAALALTKGEATKADLDDLISANNICRALVDLGFGSEYKEVSIRGMEALFNVCQRGIAKKRYVLKAEEMQAINDLLELHDAQMEIITVGDMEKAIADVHKTVRQKKALVIGDSNVRR